MSQKRYKLRFLPLFEEDLNDIVDYISIHLKNTTAAANLLDELQQAILERSDCAESFEQYHSNHECSYRRRDGGSTDYLQSKEHLRTTVMEPC